MLSNHQIETDTTDMIENLRFHPVSPQYRSVQYAYAVIIYAITASLALLLLLVGNPWWCIAAEVVMSLTFVIDLTILRKAYRFKGYALREHDITYRSGVVFPKVTTVPFSRIQQISISQNPISRYFGLCTLEIVNGAQGLSSLEIRGIPKVKADEIKGIITQRIDDND